MPAAYPKELNTIGDHLRRRRLDQELLQRQVAGRLGVNKGTIVNWECNATTPALRLWPRIIKFPGYVPYATSHSLPERIKAYRRTCGLSQKKLAETLSVDESTVGRWERGRCHPRREPLERAQALLASMPSRIFCRLGKRREA